MHPNGFAFPSVAASPVVDPDEWKYDVLARKFREWTKPGMFEFVMEERHLVALNKDIPSMKTKPFIFVEWSASIEDDEPSYVKERGRLVERRSYVRKLKNIYLRFANGIDMTLFHLHC